MLLPLAIALLFVSPALAQEPQASLSLPTISTCKDASHAVLPEKWRGTFLLAPFTKGQIVVADIVSDASLRAMRVKLHGVQRGSIDVFVQDEATYALSADAAGRRHCRRLGDTGWRALPRDWLLPQSKCAGAATLGETSVDSWKTPVAPQPATYWVWYKASDRSPFRTVFPYADDRLPPFSRYALSYQVSFEAIQRSDLAMIANDCRTSRTMAHGRPGTALQAMIDDMSRASQRATDEIARLIPGLEASCPPIDLPQWPDKLAITGLMTPYDFDEDPYQAEVLYDWALPAQRTRTLGGPDAGMTAQDSLLLGQHGYTVTHYRRRPPVCKPVLPGTIRPDWTSRAPCACAATINGKTPLSPDGTTRILACPLNSPRIAWTWYAVSGRPSVFMVTSLRGDEGKRQFAVLDYRQWLPGYSVASSVFDKPQQCAPAANFRTAPSPAKRCSTCHLGRPHAP